MANRNFAAPTAGLVKNVRPIWCVVSVGAAGAVTLKKRSYYAGGSTATASRSALASAPTSGTGYGVGGDGVRSVVRTDTGAWTITLQDPYQYILGVELVQTSNATGLLTAAAVGVNSGSTDVTTNTSLGNGGVVAVVLNDWSGAAVDPASGDTLTLLLTLGDASEP